MVDYLVVIYQEQQLSKNMKTTEYIILTLANYSDSELTDIDNISETFLSHARTSQDNTKVIMKVSSDSQGNYPSILTPITKYSYSEIIEILKTDEWVWKNAGVVPTDWEGNSEDLD